MDKIFDYPYILFLIQRLRLRDILNLTLVNKFIRHSIFYYYRPHLKIKKVKAEQEKCWVCGLTLVSSASSINKYVYVHPFQIGLRAVCNEGCVIKAKRKSLKMIMKTLEILMKYGPDKVIKDKYKYCKWMYTLAIKNNGMDLNKYSYIQNFLLNIIDPIQSKYLLK